MNENCSLLCASTMKGVKMFLRINSALVDANEIAYVSRRRLVLKGGYEFTAGEHESYQPIIDALANIRTIVGDISTDQDPSLVPETPASSC